MYQLEDQGEWERCYSFRRMFLALIDAGEDLEPVADELVTLAKKHRRGSKYTKRAQNGLTNGLAAEEAADRVYLALEAVVQAFDRAKKGEVRVPGGGESVVCIAVRRWFPLAPTGFRKVGSMVGNPKEPAEHAARVFPNKLTLLFNQPESTTSG